MSGAHKSNSESNTRHQLITPALQQAGWDRLPHILDFEHAFTDGRIVIAGREGIGHASPGTADRNRTTSPKGLQAIPVSLPPLAKQQAFNQLQSKVAELLALQAAQRQQLEQLRKQALEQAFEGAT